MAISVRGLVKRFGGATPVTALDGVDLTVRRGTVLGVLGPNGAGKTTLVRILSTLIRPDAGTAVVGGLDVLRDARDLRRLIGLTGQYAAVDAKLSGLENLYLIARLLDVPRRAARARAREMLERFSLTEAGNRPAGTYSGGMRRRLDLAASIVGEPAVLFLDEPTTGLDPRTRNEVWDEVRRMTGNGTTVLLTTQYMEEAERLADALAVVDRGKVIADGPVEELRARVGGSVLRVQPADPADLPAMRAVLSGAVRVAPDEAGDEGMLRIPVQGDDDLTAVVRLLGTHGFALARVDTREPTLDEVFLTLTAGAPAPEREKAMS
ncbi:Daunorubicin/doxorubicin resistance ATP-binding protein DrrA [Streptomyces sp. RB5]|uniref:ABC-type xenobiotic transporter n=1 Tax=Streptomyces smaragdinus TaxID=2585196 RepID=A0A7K0CCT9_9ACTN|nr:Daunorubicin/doxorubicin resistance ATP-binding protein DrrA [Streptomyces smaragdinus]